MNISYPALITVLFLALIIGWLIIVTLVTRQDRPLVFITLKVKRDHKTNVQVVADALYSPVHLKTNTYSFDNIFELEPILIKFIKDNFDYSLTTEDNIQLRNCFHSGKDFYLDINDPKGIRIKITLFYQKSNRVVFHDQTSQVF